MGIFNILKKTAIMIGERRVKNIAVETAKVMMKTAFLRTQLFCDALKPHEFAMASIYNRPGWSIGDNVTLQLDGIDTNIRFIEGVDIADIIGFVASMELSTDPNIEYAFDNQRMILLAEEVATTFVLQNCKRSLLRNRR